MHNFFHVLFSIFLVHSPSFVSMSTPCFCALSWYGVTESVVHPQLIQCGWQDVKIQEVTNLCLCLSVCAHPSVCLSISPLSPLYLSLPTLSLSLSESLYLSLSLCLCLCLSHAPLLSLQSPHLFIRQLNIIFFGVIFYLIDFFSVVNFSGIKTKSSLCVLRCFNSCEDLIVGL